MYQYLKILVEKMSDLILCLHENAVFYALFQSSIPLENFSNSIRNFGIN